MATVRKLVVEVIDARNLLPKDGHGTSSPYVVADFDGQRRRTQTAHRDLNPTWNKALDFKVMGDADLAGEILEVDVLHDRRVGPTRRNNFLGRVRLNSGQFVRKGEEAHMYYPLEKKSFFSWIQGDIGLKIYYVDDPIPPPPENAGASDAPPVPPPEATSDAVKSDALVEPHPEANPPIAADPTTDAGKSDAPVVPKVEPAVEAPAVPPPEAISPPPAEPAILPLEAVPDAVKPPDSDPPKLEQAAGDPPPSPPPLPPQAGSIDTEKEASPVWESQVKLSRHNFEPRSNRRSSSDIYGPPERITNLNDRPSYDLVEKMHYLFVRIVKARSLPGDPKPFVKIAVSGSQVRSRIARKTSFYEWNQTFAFAREAPEFASTFEVSVWAQQSSKPDSSDAGDNFLGGVCFDLSEIAIRDPPDSPLAPQWYRLEGGEAQNSDLMLATWIGTQADEAFSDAWKTDTAGNISSRSKVYLSPKLWYVRATVLEAQDLFPLAASRETGFLVKAQLGFQVLKTRTSVGRNGGSPLWNEDLIFVAAEPFGDQLLVFSLENRNGKETAVLGFAKIALSTIERRVDDRKVVSRWLNLEDSGKRKSYNGRIHVRVCFDGGYHVMDESAHVSSDYRPTARQLWKPPIGTVELGILGCRNLLPMKTFAGKGSTDAYSVAKYGGKWVRTRTVSDSLDPRWNEQYTWQVYDPCTVLTIGVFDSWDVYEVDQSKASTRQDFRIGKVRIRLSTLECNTVYRNTYQLLLMSPAGVKKMGELELAIRFVRATTSLDLLHVYTQPLHPLMHYVKPIGVPQQDALRNTAAKIIAVHLSRSEPPMRPEVVLYMLDVDWHVFSMRKVRANWYRIMSVLSEVIHMAKWLDSTRSWRNPTTTLLVHALLAMIVWYPDLIVPALSFYVFTIGAWNYRYRKRAPLPQLCVKLSQADDVDRDDLDEEFDSLPSAKSPEMVRARYDRLRTLGARVQTVLGDVATQFERVQALVTWRDPRATGIFVGMCFAASIVLYVVPLKMVAIASGFYYLRHPMFRDRMPPQTLNFFRRLPSLSDRIM